MHSGKNMLLLRMVMMDYLTSSVFAKSRMIY